VSGTVFSRIFKDRHPTNAPFGWRKGFRIRFAPSVNLVPDTFSWPSVDFHLVPGPKLFQVALDAEKIADEQGTTPAQVIAQFEAAVPGMIDQSDAQFDNAYKDYSIDLPLGSAQSKQVCVYAFDAYRNPIEAGRDAHWALTGSGGLGEPDPEVVLPTNNAEEYADSIGHLGKVEIKYTQRRYPTCPFSPNTPEEELRSGVELAVDGKFTDAGISITTRSEALPAQLQPVVIEAYPTSVGGVALSPGLGDWIDPDIHKKDEVVFEAIVTRGGIGIEGADVFVNSTNGKIKEGTTVNPTDDTGSTSFTLTSIDAQVKPFLIIASVANTSAIATPDNAKWVSTAPAYMVVEREILSGNRQNNGIYSVETLDDTGESHDIPGAVEGDGWLGVPVYVETPVHIFGEPNHTYKVYTTSTQVIDQSTRSHYPLDEIENGVTPDILLRHIINEPLRCLFV